MTKIQYNKNLRWDIQESLPPINKQVLFYRKGFQSMISKDYFVCEMKIVNGMPSIDGSEIKEDTYWCELPMV